MNVLAHVETSDSMGLADIVVIANISEHGARLLSDRQRAVRERLVVTEVAAFSGYRATAEVIYCETLAKGQFALGVRFVDEGVSPLKGNWAG
jgi:hypothetical protein